MRAPSCWSIIRLRRKWDSFISRTLFWTDWGRTGWREEEEPGDGDREEETEMEGRLEGAWEEGEVGDWDLEPDERWEGEGEGEREGDEGDAACSSRLCLASRSSLRAAGLEFSRRTKPMLVQKGEAIFGPHTMTAGSSAPAERSRRWWASLRARSFPWCDLRMQMSAGAQIPDSVAANPTGPYSGAETTYNSAR